MAGRILERKLKTRKKGGEPGPPNATVKYRLGVGDFEYTSTKKAGLILRLTVTMEIYFYKPGEKKAYKTHAIETKGCIMGRRMTGSLTGTIWFSFPSYRKGSPITLVTPDLAHDVIDLVMATKWGPRIGEGATRPLQLLVDPLTETYEREMQILQVM